VNCIEPWLSVLQTSQTNNRTQFKLILGACCKWPRTLRHIISLSSSTIMSKLSGQLIYSLYVMNSCFVGLLARHLYSWGKNVLLHCLKCPQKSAVFSRVKSTHSNTEESNLLNRMAKRRWMDADCLTAFSIANTE